MTTEISEKEKNREYQKKWYLANKQKQIDRNYERRKRIKAQLRDYKSKLKCETCGEDHPSCIDFHHIDPNKKEIAIYEAVGKSWGWEKIEKEIGKCQILCANCHRKIHWKDRGKLHV